MVVHSYTVICDSSVRSMMHVFWFFVCLLFVVDVVVCFVLCLLFFVLFLFLFCLFLLFFFYNVTLAYGHVYIYIYQ